MDAEARRRERRMRAAAHACPECHRPWHLKVTRHPAGVWAFSCKGSDCDWNRIMRVALGGLADTG